MKGTDGVPGSKPTFLNPEPRTISTKLSCLSYNIYDHIYITYNIYNHCSIWANNLVSYKMTYFIIMVVSSFIFLVRSQNSA